MRRVLGVIFLALSVACTSWAQQASSDTTPAAKEGIQKLFAALHLTEMMRNVMTASMQQSKQLAHDTIKKKQPDVTEEQLKRVDALIDNFTKTRERDAGFL